MNYLQSGLLNYIHSKEVMKDNQMLSDQHIVPQSHCTIHKYFHEIKTKIYFAFIINNPKLFIFGPTLFPYERFYVSWSNS